MRVGWLPPYVADAVEMETPEGGEDFEVLTEAELESFLRALGDMGLPAGISRFAAVGTETHRT